MKNTNNKNNKMLNKRPQNGGKRKRVRNRYSISGDGRLPTTPGYSGGAFSSAIRTMEFTPANPGRARIRSVIEVTGSGTIGWSYTDFNLWSSKLRSLLTPFQYFRVDQACVSAMVTGGTASPYSIIFNVSNDANTDTGSVAILDDDYSAVATAAIQPVLEPPKAYWTQGARKWFNAADAVGGQPSPVDRIAGTISYSGTGGATSTTVVGWLEVDTIVEFHTLT